MEDKNYYPKGTYVVLLRTCNGDENCWNNGRTTTPMHVNNVHKLTNDSSSYNFSTEYNGWNNTPSNIKSQLLLRKATPQEIIDYSIARKPIKSRHTLIEGFAMKELEMSEPVIENQKLTRYQVKEIYDIACSDWKKIIDSYVAKQPFNDEIEFDNKMVSEMFKAATKDQRPVLQRLFGNFDLIYNEHKIYVHRSNSDIFKLHRVMHDRYAWINLEKSEFWANGPWESGQEALDSIDEFVTLSNLSELANYIKNQL